MTPPLDRDIEDTRDEEYFRHEYYIHDDPDYDDFEYDWDRDTELERE